MKQTILRPAILALATLLTAFASSASAAEPPAQIKPPEADQVLRWMSATLATANQFSFNAHRETKGKLPGLAGLEDARIKVLGKRPDSALIKSKSKGDVRDFYFDGKNLTVMDVTRNYYSTVPMKTSIDGLLAKLETQYGFTPPLGSSRSAIPLKTCGIRCSPPPTSDAAASPSAFSDFAALNVIGSC